MRTLVVTDNEAGQRLDKLLAKYMDQAGKGFLYKMIRKKNITLNGKRCDGSEKLAPGDEIRLFLSDETIEKFSGNSPKRTAPPAGYSPRLSILYEDAHVLIVNKPAGLLSQKAKEGDHSLNEEILDYLIDSGHLAISQLRTFRPSICNRLDRNTSGIVTAGCSLAGLQILNQVFKDRSIHKYYRCLVKGDVREKKLIAGFLYKDSKSNRVQVLQTDLPGSSSIMTEYQPVAWGGGFTLLQVTLITGKSHQIRAHLASIGHPIAGDFKYGDPKVNEQLKKAFGLDRQLLHSWKLVFPKDLQPPLDYLAGREFTAPLPGHFKKVLDGLGIKEPLPAS